jgi:hypothetical protein
MRKRIHVINCCKPLLWTRVRPSEMVRVFLLSMLFVGFLGTACGQRNDDNERLPGPGIAIPVHIITKADVERTVEVESGDWLEFELPLTDGASVWKPRVEDGLPLTKANDMGSRQSDTGLVQVFRFQTHSVGTGKVTFELLRPATGTIPEQAFSFTIAIR